MLRQILPVFSLLLGSALLLTGGGLHGLLLPVRGTIEGFDSLSLGLLGTGWALGYVAGCVITARIVARVGHIRAFSAMAALAAVAVLLNALVVLPWAWIVLRAVIGFCFAATAMIVESWLSERTDPSNRGRVFGVYTMVNLAASTAGQMLLALGEPAGFFFFALTAIFYCLALVPTALSNASTPAPLASVQLNLRRIWRNSPVAVFGVFWVGVSNAAFGTLAAVYAQNAGLVLTAVALFSSIPILAGAVMQLPVGQLSDRMDRRGVLAGVALLALLTDGAFLVLAPEGQILNFVLAALLGGSIFAMYPVIVAHANDHAEPGTAIQISGGLLLVYGVGAIIGPLAGGWVMGAYGFRMLFAVTAAAHLATLLFTLWRMRKRDAVPEPLKSSFQPLNAGRTSALQTAEIVQPDPDAEAEAEETPAPPQAPT